MSCERAEPKTKVRIVKLRVKIEIALLAALLLSICGLFTISKWTTKTDFVRFENADMRRHGKDGREMPTNSNVNFTFRVESPSSFFIENMRDVNGPHVDGIAFKLLGIKEPIGDERRQKAVEFIKKWLEEAKLVWFINFSQALQDDSGTWIVWVHGMQNRDSGSLNVALVEAGLADVDDSEHLNYEFRQPEYGGLGPFGAYSEIIGIRQQALA